MNPSVNTLRARIIENPWRAVGGAALLGALLAVQQPRLPRARFARTVLAAVGAFAVRAAGNHAARRLLHTAQAWASGEPPIVKQEAPIHEVLAFISQMLRPSPLN